MSNRLTNKQVIAAVALLVGIVLVVGCATPISQPIGKTEALPKAEPETTFPETEPTTTTTTAVVWTPENCDLLTDDGQCLIPRNDDAPPTLTITGGGSAPPVYESEADTTPYVPPTPYELCVGYMSAYWVENRASRPAPMFWEPTVLTAEDMCVHAESDTNPDNKQGFSVPLAEWDWLFVFERDLAAFQAAMIAWEPSMQPIVETVKIEIHPLDCNRWSSVTKVWHNGCAQAGDAYIVEKILGCSRPALTSGVAAPSEEGSPPRGVGLHQQWGRRPRSGAARNVPSGL